ncbi:transposase [Streptomyces sp. NPDC059153]|uniref:transposase n=1 Tax=Streptomyces sp. NPDC059153 TaxID=3346743 RepID=UPI00369385E9
MISLNAAASQVLACTNAARCPVPCKLADGRCPACAVTADCTMLPAVLDAIRVPRALTGRPRTRPNRVVADKAYSSRRIRNLLRRRRIKATIPERRDQIANRACRARRGGRPPAFDKTAYKGRNVVERCSARLKQFRVVATRFDKLAARYRAGVVIAALVLWLRAEG